MAVSSFGAGMVGIMEVLVVALLGGGMGLPLGVPPEDPDPMMTRIAPEECLYYTTWVGMATPNGDGENQTEQLLAEPEVRTFVQELERAVGAAADKAAADAPNDEAAMLMRNAPFLAKTLISHSTTLFVADVRPRSQGFDATGALVVKLGDEAEKVSGLVDRFLATAPPDVAEKVTISGIECTRLRLEAEVPVITVGRKKDYLIMALGEKSFARLLERAETPPPQWLADAIESLPISRMASLAYMDVESSLNLLSKMAPPNIQRIMDVMGVSSLTTLVSASGLDKTGFVSRVKLGSSDPNRGLGRLVTDQPLQAEDLADVPADASLALAFKLDLQRVMSRGIEWMREVEPRAAEQMQGGLRELERPLGVSIEEDLLAALSDVWTLHTAPSSGGLAAGWTATCKLKDADKAQAAHQQLLKFANAVFAQQRGRAPRIRAFAYGDQEAYTLEVPDDGFVLAPSWCLTDTHLVVTLLPQALKSFLARSDAETSLADHPKLAQLLAMDNGPCSLSYQDARGQFVTFYPFVQYAAQAFARQMRQEGFDIDVTALPSINAVAPHLLPSVSMTRKVDDGFELYTHTTLPGANLGASAPVAVALLLPAVQASREAARRAQSMNNLKQLGLAMHNYHDTYTGFPAAYNVDKDGEPLLSWRVHILPFIEQQALYERFHFDEPWDSEHNRKLIAQMPQVYRSPNSKAEPGKTVYLGNASEDGVHVPPEKEQQSQEHPTGTRFRDIADGTSNTIMMVEVNDANAVTWTKPEDFELDEKNPLGGGLRGMRPGAFLAAFCDGHVRTIKTSIDPKLLKALFTRDGGERVGNF
ncbi:MAG: DUF1559 domain-containing protein [Planctomycetota bacterium]